MVQLLNPACVHFCYRLFSHVTPLLFSWWWDEPHFDPPFAIWIGLRRVCVGHGAVLSMCALMWKALRFTSASWKAGNVDLLRTCSFTLSSPESRNHHMYYLSDLLLSYTVLFLKKKNFFRLGLTCSWFQIEYHAEVESGMFRGSRRAARWHSGLHTQAQTLPRSPRQPSSAAFDLSKLRSNRDQCGFAYKSCFIVYNNRSIFSCLFLALPPPLQLLNQISSSDSSVRCKYGQLLHTIRPNVFHLNLAGCDPRVVTVSFIEVNIVVHHSSFHCTFCAGCCLFVQITDFDPYRTFLLKLY